MNISSNFRRRGNSDMGALLASLLLCVFALMPPGLRAQTNDLSAALQRGLFEEEANHNLDVAAQAYQSVAAQHDKDRKLAATAIFRLGEVYRKQGRTNEANAQYERIVREFPDQTELVRLSRPFVGSVKSNVILPGESLEVFVNEDDTLHGVYQVRQGGYIFMKNIGKIMVAGKDMAGAEQAIKEALQENHIKNATVIVDRPVADKTRTASVATTDEEEKEIRRIQAMIQNSPDLINAKDGQGSAPLHYAAQKGQTTVAKFILDSGADIESRTKGSGATPLQLAAANGHKALVESLLNRKADIQATDGSGATALHLAASKGFKTVVELLLASNAEVSAKDSVGDTPLHYAAAGGHKAIVEALIAHKADVNAKNQSGATPLIKAIVNKQFAVAKTLVTNKAELNFSSTTTMDGGVRPSFYPLHFAVLAKNDEFFELLLKNGANPDVVDQQGDTPLHMAAQGNRKGTVELLLKYKANPNLKVNSFTPLLTAISANCGDCATTLLAHGADPNEKDQNGFAPLHFAVQHGLKEVVEALLANKADVNARDKDERTPLFRAIETKNKEICEILLSHGADADEKYRDGMTPLHLAVAYHQKEIAEALFAHKADVNAQTVQGETPLRWAVGSVSSSYNDKDIAELLRQHGALEDVPDFSSIRVMRQFQVSPRVVFRKGTNAFNRFTLFEVLRSFNRTPQFPSGLPPGSLPFPDLSRIEIFRPVSTKSNEKKEIPVYVLAADNSFTFDCTKDVTLEFGDVINIPEREHALNEMPVGWTDSQFKALSDCLLRHVTVVVKGQSSDVTIGGDANTAFLSTAMRLPSVQSILRSSSDLSRVKVKRTDPATKKSKEFVLDVEKFWKAPQPSWEDLWLRDGDVIEVPDKP